MGKRSGDIDQTIIQIINEKEKKEIQQIIDILNKKSGLYGICNESDMRNIYKNSKRNKNCQLAIDMFTNRLLNYIGAYKAQLKDIDAIVFSGGIGEGAWYIREKIANQLGISIDHNKNNAGIGIISKESKTKLIVIPSNEELMIARETYPIIKNNRISFK